VAGPGRQCCMKDQGVIQLLLRRAGCGHKGNAYARAGPVGVCCGASFVCAVGMQRSGISGLVYIAILIVCHVEG
jgi:glyoxylate carboligase